MRHLWGGDGGEGVERDSATLMEGHTYKTRLVSENE